MDAVQIGLMRKLYKEGLDSAYDLAEDYMKGK